MVGNMVAGRTTLAILLSGVSRNGTTKGAGGSYVPTGLFMALVLTAGSMALDAERTRRAQPP